MDLSKLREDYFKSISDENFVFSDGFDPNKRKKKVFIICKRYPFLFLDKLSMMNKHRFLGFIKVSSFVFYKSNSSFFSFNFIITQGFYYDKNFYVNLDLNCDYNFSNVLLNKVLASTYEPIRIIKKKLKKEKITYFWSLFNRKIYRKVKNGRRTSFYKFKIIKLIVLKFKNEKKATNLMKQFSLSEIRESYSTYLFEGFIILMKILIGIVPFCMGRSFILGSENTLYVDYLNELKEEEEENICFMDFRSFRMYRNHHKDMQKRAKMKRKFITKFLRKKLKKVIKEVPKFRSIVLRKETVKREDWYESVDNLISVIKVFDLINKKEQEQLKRHKKH